MSLKNQELILFALNEVLLEKNKNLTLTLESFANILNVKEESLKVYLSSLSKEGFIERDRKHFQNNIIEKIIITEKGYEKIKYIDYILKKSVFTPENHGIDKVWSFFDLYNKYNNIFEKIFILTLFVKLKKFDLNTFINNFDIIKDGRTLSRIFNEHFCLSKMKPGSYGKEIMKMSIYGLDNKEQIIENQNCKFDVDTSIIIAESSRRRGEFEVAMRQFQDLLSSRYSLNENQWFQVQLNLICLKYENGDCSSIRNDLEKLSSQTSDTILSAYLLEMEGMVEYFEKNYDKAVKKISSSIRSFHKFDEKFFLSISYNNRGVVYFNLEKYYFADKDWRKALKYAQSIKNKYCESIIYPNLADIEINRNNFQKANRYLDKADKLLDELGIFKGKEAVEFNRSLLYLKMGNLRSALEHFHASENITPSFPTPKERSIRREWFFNKAKEMGFSNIELLFEDEEK